MARSCACDRWLTRAASDPGFHVLPHIAQLLWFRLLAAAVGAEEKGHLRFPCSVPLAVSRWLNRSETEADSDLRMLLDLGWIEIDADGRGLWMQGAKAGAARAEAARINGLKGGRRRNGETPQAYRERRQGAFMLPIQGGAEKTQETETEPNQESSRAAAKPSPIEEAEAKPRATPAWVTLAAELAEIAGLDQARGAWTALPVKGWLDAGVTPDVIREVVRTVSARPRPDGKPIGSLQFFSRAVMEAHERAPRPAVREVASDWDEAIRHWQANGRQGLPPSLEEWRAQRTATA